MAKRRPSLEAKKCPQCQKWFYFRPGYRVRTFCSQPCHNGSKMKVRPGDIAGVCAARLDGQSWRSIARRFGISVDNLQQAVWYELSRSEKLTVDYANAVWGVDGNARAQSGKWDRLVERTGIAPVGAPRCVQT